MRSPFTDGDSDGARQTPETIEPVLRHLVPAKMCDKLTAHIDNFGIDKVLEMLTAMENLLKKMKGVMVRTLRKFKNNGKFHGSGLTQYTVGWWRHG
jgi:hypothetical protein